MSKRLSQGIRIYEHAPDGSRNFRDAYNYGQGMRVIARLKTADDVKFVAVGSESGAMVVHYKMAHRTWIS